MKDYPLYLSAIIAGVLTVLGISLVLVGPEKTTGGIKVLGETISPRNREQTQAQFATASLSNSDLSEGDDYADLNLQNVKTVITARKAAPLAVPTNGIAAHKNFLYEYYKHAGIDIWTSVSGKGLDGKSSVGYPVYAACTGLVTRVYLPNQEIEIVCDPLPDYYKDVVPSLKIKTLYSHLGDAVTKERYHKLKVGQRVTKGEQIGYQGNQSSIAPQNRVTHLHFGIYDLSGRGRPPLNPEPYIGYSTTTLGQVYKVDQK